MPNIAFPLLLFEREDTSIPLPFLAVLVLCLMDKGWNALRDQISANQKTLGVVPQNARPCPTNCPHRRSVRQALRRQRPRHPRLLEHTQAVVER